MTIATKLSEARLLIERGWCQGISHDGDCYCALGACAAVADGDDYFEMRGKLQRATRNRFVTIWNDRPQRTKTEVIEAFKRAEHLARDGAE